MDDMRDRIVAAAKRQKTKCAEFLRTLIATPSESRHEEGVATLVRKEMLKLGYKHAEIDRFGNIIGKIGEGRTTLLLDAHIDTTGIGDRSSWRFDPYAGDLKAGKVYGHGAANNKGGLAAIVYAGALIQDLDLATDYTVYVVGSVQAEECEGVAYKAIFDVEKTQPDFVVLSMPTGMRICRGHRGRAELEITVRGQLAHASDPEKGINPIYAMAKIVQGIEDLDKKLPTDKFLGKASVAVTDIATEPNGPNAIPEWCRITIDRRFIPGETDKKILQQLKAICKGARAKVDIVEYDLPSYRGLRLPMQKYFPAWTIDADHPLVDAAEGAYQSVFKKPPTLDRWTMSTAGVYTMGVHNIPTIGFGPSEEAHAGPINDHVRIDDLEKSIAFYASLLSYLPDVDPAQLRRRR